MQELSETPDMAAGEAAPLDAAERPDLPPLFTARPLPGQADPLATAVGRAARGGAEAGELLFAVRPDRARAALVLAPEAPFSKSAEIIYVAMTALNDALGATLPAQIGVLFGWPDRILINGAEGGRLHYATPTVDPTIVPDWLVIGFELALLGDLPEDPGLVIDRTNLFEEGAGEVAPKAILESFARHFLSWLHRWETEGLARVAAAWEARMAGVEDAYAFPPPDGSDPAGGRISARAAGVAPDGAMRIRLEDGERRLSAARAFRLIGAAEGADA
jgi:BirA family biotin operon repressor/biotin-[acetyl-CoA-carboxylase] ligase